MKKLLLPSLFLLPALLAENGSQPYYEKVGKQALPEIRWNWKSLLGNWRINFLPGRTLYLGLADHKAGRIDIWVRPEHSPAIIAGVIVHELAHRVDLLFLTPEQRAEWRRIRGIPRKTPWYPPLPAAMAHSDFPPSDNNTGAGDFAECVVRTLQGATVKFKSHLGPPPTPKQQQVIRQWLTKLNTAGN
jgi:hypothetical protein